MIVILLGAPGSGKGTQSMRLAEKYGFTHLATGDIFRAEMEKGTPLGLKAQGYVNAGRLVPDDVVTEMVAARLKPGVVGHIRVCDARATWCEGQVGDYRGYLRREDLYGVYPGEAVN